MQEPPRPVPDLSPQPITMEQYEAFTAEKIELWAGYLFGPPDFHDYRRDMLLLLLVNEGLEQAVRLAPLERWREALRRVELEP
jgi:hypothetical protein